MNLQFPSPQAAASTADRCFPFRVSAALLLAPAFASALHAAIESLPFLQPRQCQPVAVLVAWRCSRRLLTVLLALLRVS
jgi:hypothetical protein